MFWSLNESDVCSFNTNKWACCDPLKSVCEWKWCYICIKFVLKSSFYVSYVLQCFSCMFFLFFQSFLCIICVTCQGTCIEGICEKRIIFFLSNKQNNWIPCDLVLTGNRFMNTQKTTNISKDVYLQYTLNPNTHHWGYISVIFGFGLNISASELWWS